MLCRTLVLFIYKLPEEGERGSCLSDVSDTFQKSCKEAGWIFAGRWFRKSAITFSTSRQMQVESKYLHQEWKIISMPLKSLILLWNAKIYTSIYTIISILKYEMQTFVSPMFSGKICFMKSSTLTSILLFLPIGGTRNFHMNVSECNILDLAIQMTLYKDFPP